MTHSDFFKTALAAAMSLSLAGTALAAQKITPLSNIALAQLASDKPIGKTDVVATFTGAMPTGVTVTDNGRIFVNFPRWGDDVPFTVGEVKAGKVVAYPNTEVNQPDNSRPADRFLSVQSVVFDGQGYLWVLDTAAPKFSTPVPGGAKLVAIDLKTNRIAKTIVFPASVILPATYVNDVRFDFRAGKAGVAYVTDSSLSGTGGIIVVDLATGDAVRRLTGDRSTSPEQGFVPVVEGETLLQRHPDGTTAPFSVASDGIALSADGKTLYYSPLSGRHLYAVSTASLRSPDVSEAQLAQQVRDLGEKGASDGLESDANGAVYAGDYERNAIRRMTPDGKWTTIAHGPQILWPDTLSVGPDGYLYFTVNQLHRQPGFHGGKDLRQKPYSLMRVRIDAAPAPTR
ncbi:L-dopachrome tautomerase-related protein [Enterobacillus tribolii]|uniref:Sugar lactone lactonase YvrE n=1 Tax=Enterobacillus tribolii TaxID=1487935 RepID=A0A370R275_9GAMM|nr:L-dopachrome tautomerase-related protein [Enterobacillus tribolii]MBW7984827.1 gluconolaconase [Enterobacillus tribolii]RDK96019.1 sugar lactone lactonase YvrE [Enterobacillus tribolii]